MLGFNTDSVVKFINELEIKTTEEREEYLKTLSDSDKIELIMAFCGFMDAMGNAMSTLGQVH